MIFKIGICDDEEMIVKINHIYIEEIAKKHNINIELYEANSGEEIIKVTKANKLDILFIDIDMDGITGIQAAAEIKKINRDAIIIFVTGHREFALEAFEVEAVGYLVKPIEPARMEKLLVKSLKQIVMERQKVVNSMLIITEDNVKKRIPQYKIISIEKQKNQCIAIMQEGSHYFYDTIYNVKSKLDTYFYQINQGIIINIKYVKSLEGSRLILKNGMDYMVGRKYIKEIRNALYNE